MDQAAFLVFYELEWKYVFVKHNAPETAIFREI